MNERVMLINPPMTYFERIEPIRLPQPVGICYIGAYLEKHGYEVKILDAHAEGYHNRFPMGDRTQVGLDETQIKAEVLKFNPAVIGVSSMFMDQHKNAHMVCRAAKSALPGVPVVMGGVYPTMLPERVLKDDNIDYVIRAESELSFKEFCDWKIRGDQSIYVNVDGLNLNKKNRWIENLDDMPFPARHLLSLEKYFNAGRAYREVSHKKNAFPIITSRCCPAACNYCGTHEMMGKYRQRSPEDVIEEIEFLIENYGMEEIYFLDDALAHGNFIEVLKLMAKKKYGLAWHGANGTAIYSMNNEIIRLFAQTGCYKIIFSIESGVTSTLKYMKKPVSLSTVPKIIKKVQSLGMRAESMFIIGLPIETKEDINNTVKFAGSLGLDYVSFPLATPFMGTPFHQDCLKRGSIKEDIPLEDLKFGIAHIKGIDWEPEWVENVRREAWLKLNPDL
jgi:anaerobic magnesium-protoporphyrin IX monomethyl ester cyclase